MELFVNSVKRDWGRVPKQADSNGCYRCSKCRVWKQPTLFSKNKNQTTGLNYACKECMAVHTRKWNLPAKYNINSEQFQKMLVDQNNSCASCETPFVANGKRMSRPHVDHNHKTGQVRGLLCGLCNMAAGKLKDSSDQAQRLANYLKKWNC
jgi:hypothetical protein